MEENRKFTKETLAYVKEDNKMKRKFILNESILIP